MIDPNVLVNIANTLAPVQKMVSAASYLMGITFIFKAMMTLKMLGEARSMMSGQQSIKEPIMYLLVGGILMYFPSTLHMMMATVFGYSSPLAYAPINLPGRNVPLGRPLMIIIQTIGMIAFIRGWVLIARAGAHGQQPGGIGKGLMHIFGGIMAINLVGTLQIINNTLYGS